MTSQGQKATQSHTGALSENSQLIKSIIKQSGVIPAQSFHELFQFSRTFSMMYNAKKKFPIKGGVAMIAGSGGAGTISADLTIKYGLKFPNLSDNIYHLLEDVFPSWMPPNKFALIDIWPAMEKAMTNRVKPEVVMDKIYRAIIEDPEIEGLFNMLFCSKKFSAMNNIDNILKNAQLTQKPIFFWLIGEKEEVKRISELLANHNIPDYPSLEEMVKNFWILVQESKNRNIFIQNNKELL